MAAVEIRALERLTEADLNRIAAGFTTRQVYVVRKTETPEQTVIALDRRDLDAPLVRTFERPRTLIGFLSRRAATGPLVWRLRRRPAGRRGGGGPAGLDGTARLWEFSRRAVASAQGSAGA